MVVNQCMKITSHGSWIALSQSKPIESRHFYLGIYPCLKGRNKINWWKNLIIQYSQLVSYFSTSCWTDPDHPKIITLLLQACAAGIRNDGCSTSSTSLLTLMPPITPKKDKSGVIRPLGIGLHWSLFNLNPFPSLLHNDKCIFWSYISPQSIL